MSYALEHQDVVVEETDMITVSAGLNDETDEDDDFADTDVLESSDFAETALLEDDMDDSFLNDPSTAFDVAELLADFEQDNYHLDPSRRARKRIEALAERKRRHQDLLDFDDYEIEI